MARPQKSVEIHKEPSNGLKGYLKTNGHQCKSDPNPTHCCHQIKIFTIEAKQNLQYIIMYPHNKTFSKKIVIF